MNYQEKFEHSIASLPFLNLREKDRLFLKKKSHELLFGHQDLRQIVNLAVDLKMWQEPLLENLWPDEINFDHLSGKQKKQKLLSELYKRSEKIKEHVVFNREALNTSLAREKVKILPAADPLNSKILGRCPVASEKTLCCNLITLDAVQNCGLGCSYCSIQTFYTDNKAYVEDNLLEKLRSLSFDPNQTYHVGTGQSSDSLMWGNLSGILDGLLTFAKENPNVILEFKTKSNNVSYLLKQEIPRNVICTWSLNPDVVIQNEEHYSASLDQRLKAARSLADKGVKVGFHLHPIVHYEGFEKDYQDIGKRLTSDFDSSEVALVSLGTLTFTKKVMSTIRSRDFHSKILQMPMVDAAGKFSYPKAVKLSLFKNAYDSLALWHDKVFFYLCMEDRSYWKPVFGFEFDDNTHFEKSMKQSYLNKINGIQEVSK